MSKPTHALITGGCRSGKSRYALKAADDLAATATASAPRRCFIATAEGLDDEMRGRIARHRSDRGPEWDVVEAPRFLAAALTERARSAADAVVIVDCLTLWTTNWLLYAPADRMEPPDENQQSRNLSLLDDELAKVLSLLPTLPAPVYFVTNEVGLGVVPENSLARRFRDAAGLVNQRVAAAVDRVVLMVSGLPLVLKGSTSDGASS
ncbi:MAG: bifunctional adenosylcobinamide kinase/adenosylcobinamide-phosphate guanylyltransferase [Planctomycetia bacterium]